MFSGLRPIHMFPRLSTLLLVGGCTKENEKGTQQSIETIRLEEAENNQLKVSQHDWGRLSVARRSPSVFSRPPEGLLVFGGCETTNRHLNSLEVVVNGSSKGISPLPQLEEHSCAAYCSLNEKEALIIGGFNGPDCLKQVLLVNKETHSVKQLPDFCSRLKNSVALSISNDSLLLIGGWDEKETMRTVFRVTLDESRQNYMTTMEGLLPYPIEGHGAVRNSNSIFIVGGYDGISVRNTIIKMDIESGQKQILPIGLESARENLACALLAEKYLVVAGGWDGRKALDSVEIFKILDESPFLEKIPTDIRLAIERNRPGFVAI